MITSQKEVYQQLYLIFRTTSFII